MSKKPLSVLIYGPAKVGKSSQHVGNNSTYKELVSMMEEFQLQQY
jgi:hypothetical protein